MNTSLDSIDLNSLDPYTTVIRDLRGLFLDDDQDGFDFLMYYFASLLTEYSIKNIFVILQGNGSNGKSLITELMINVLSDINIQKIPIQTLLTNNTEQVSSYNVNLKNTRLAYYSEPIRNETLNTTRLMELTRQKTISGRELYRGQEKIKLNCNHLIQTNYNLSVNNSIKHRVFVIPMQIKFVNSPDPNSKFEKKANPSLYQTLVTNKYMYIYVKHLLRQYQLDLHMNFNNNILLIPQLQKFRHNNIY